MRKRDDILGSRYCNNLGFWGTVTIYSSNKKVTITFDEPYYDVTTVPLIALKSGLFKNRNAPSVYGWGIIGEGPLNREAYACWTNMLARVFDTKYHERQPAYKDTRICADWQRFKNFSDWYVKQVKESGWQLDKDWIVAGNREYGPNTCVFVPREINNFLENNSKTRGLLPIGVRSKGNKFVAYTGSSSSKYLGIFNTAREAYFCYETNKENYAKELLSKWRFRLDEKLQLALKNYRVRLYVKTHFMPCFYRVRRSNG